MKKIISILSGLFLFASLNTSAGDFLLNEYNVITIENFTSSGGTHVDGKVFVGGNFTGVENVGSMVKHGNNIDVLTVAGTMQTATYVHNNNIILSAENHALSVVGNDADDNTSINGITVNTKGNVEQSTDLASIKADYKAQLENSSAYFASLKANSSLITKNNKEVLTVSNTLGANDIAVFSLDDATNIFNSSGNNISLSNSNKKNDLNGLEDLAAIIINVSGEKLSIAQNSNMNDIINNANIRAKVIWNFYEATSID